MAQRRGGTVTVVVHRLAGHGILIAVPLRLIWTFVGTGFSQVRHVLRPSATMRAYAMRLLAQTGAIGLAVALVIGPLPASGDEDEAPPRAAIEAGEIAPLEQLLARLRERFPGRILEVELEREDDRPGPGWVYEVKLLTPSGQVLKLEYDARTMELIEVKGRHDDHGRHVADD
jgi:hypothetical protein